jgi:phospholipase C
MILFSMLLLCTISLLALLGGCGGGGSSSMPSASTKIQHVVVIFQENRTPDNLFQDPVLISNGADIQNFGINSKGERVTLTASHLEIDYDPDHSHRSFVAMYDNGKMDGADEIMVGCVPNAPPPCPPPNATFEYVDPGDVAPYFALAETYTFGDRMFQTNQGPSFPAHQFIISGSSAVAPPGQPNSNLLVVDNPYFGPDPFDYSGCTAPPEERVGLIDPSSGDESKAIYPCVDRPTLTDLLNSVNLSWRYYAPSAGIIWNAPNAIQHMCVPNAAPPNGTTCTGSDWTKHVVIPQTQVLTDIANGQLASVSWVMPSGQASDHAGIAGASGPSWVASLVNAIGNSQYWANTAIIITWDDWGGWYDHVPPPAIINSYEYGFRVPMIVVSPYAKAKYVSHQVNDFGSILKFIEATFGLSTVAPGASPAYADAISNTGDLSDCFDFSQTPLTFRTISAPMDAQHFLEDKTPPADPDDD